jgi:hypothetical protein
LDERYPNKNHPSKFELLVGYGWEVMKSWSFALTYIGVGEQDVKACDSLKQKKKAIFIAWAIKMFPSLERTEKINQALKYDFYAAQKSIRKKISTYNQKVFKRKSQSEKKKKRFKNWVKYQKNKSLLH